MTCALAGPVETAEGSLTVDSADGSELLERYAPFGLETDPMGQLLEAFAASAE
jgi:hypothetical protein